MRSTFALASAVLVTLAAAQEQYAINPESVNITTRDYWCNQQETQCPLICLQNGENDASTRSNTCTPESLTYSCVCNNGISPNVSEYSQTLPYFICTEWGQQCVSNCNGDNSCAADCLQLHPCGAQNPTRVNSSTIVTSTTSAGSSGGTNNADATASGGDTIYTGFGNSDGGPSETGSSSGAEETGSSSDSDAAEQQDTSGAARAAVLGFGQSFGLVTVIGGLFGGFALLL